MNVRIVAWVFSTLALTQGSLACNSTNKVDMTKVDSGDACIMGATVDACPSIAPSFSSDVLPIINGQCQTCHAENNDAGLWPLNDWGTISGWRTTILEVLRNCVQPPPSSGHVLTRAEREIIEGWIECGSADN